FGKDRSLGNAPRQTNQGFTVLRQVVAPCENRTTESDLCQVHGRGRDLLQLGGVRRGADVVKALAQCCWGGQPFTVFPPAARLAQRRRSRPFVPKWSGPCNCAGLRM